MLALLPGGHHVWAAAQIPAVLDGGSRSTQLQWVPALSLSIDLRLDALAMMMTLVIAGIGTLVLLYSARYFPAGDEGLGRYSGVADRVRRRHARPGLGRQPDPAGDLLGAHRHPVATC